MNNRIDLDEQQREVVNNRIRQLSAKKYTTARICEQFSPPLSIAYVIKVLKFSQSLGRQNGTR